MADDDFNFDAIPEPPAFEFLEYIAPSGDKWRVERGKELLTDFELESADLMPTWHGAMAGQEPAAWQILRRIYTIAPLLGADPDDLRPWTEIELAKEMGVEVADVESYLTGARTFWRRVKLQGESKKAEPIKLKPTVADERVEQLLMEHGFSGIEAEEERQYIATRIGEMEMWLESDNLRSLARAAIQLEHMIMFIIDPTIRDLRKRISESSLKGGSKDDREALLKMMSSRKDQQASLEGTLKALGVTDQGGGLRKKMAFDDCLSALIDGVKAYESNADNTLIDHLFTAAEVELLITPTTLRPTQYRPDLILMAMEASQHLFEAEFSPTPLGRATCRKLHKGFLEGLAQARNEAGEVPVDETEEEISESTVAPTNEARPIIPADTATQTLPPPTRRASRGSEADAVMLAG